MNGRSLTKKKMLLFSFVPKTSLFLYFTPQYLRNRKKTYGRKASGSLYAAGSGTTRCRGTPRIPQWSMSAEVYENFQYGEHALRTHYSTVRSFIHIIDWYWRKQMHPT